MNDNLPFRTLEKRVFGVNDGVVANGCMETSPNSNDLTTNPTKHAKVHLQRDNASFDTRRVNWWIGLRTMWKALRSTLRTRSNSSSRQTCMRRRRERSETRKNYFSLSPSLTKSTKPFQIINMKFVCTRSDPCHFPGRALGVGSINYGSSLRNEINFESKNE